MKEPVINYKDSTIVVNDKPIELYEPHGFFQFVDNSSNTPGYWIAYGHEEIVVIDMEGNELKRQHTR